jgi:hypothetical protein
MTISVDYLHECFTADFCSGTIFWKSRPVSHFEPNGGQSGEHKAKRWNVRYAHTVAGSLNGSGYVTVTIGNKHHRVHRIIWAMMHGCWPKGQIDHINGVKTDNMVENLRVVTNQENQKNVGISKNNSSGVTGVYFDNRRGMWRAQIKVDGKCVFLGRFGTLEQARDARAVAAEKYGFSQRHGAN